VPADRARVAYFLTWFFWSGITHSIMDRDNGVNSRALAGVPLYLIKRLATATGAGLAGLLIGRWTSALNHAIDVAFAAGYATERWGLTARTGQARAAAAGEPV
jgi:hypothetical protein